MKQHQFKNQRCVECGVFEVMVTPGMAIDDCDRRIECGKSHDWKWEPSKACPTCGHESWACFRCKKCGASGLHFGPKNVILETGWDHEGMTCSEVILRRALGNK